MCAHLSVSSAAEPNPHFWTFDINPLSFSASAEANADGEGAGAAGSPANPCRMKAVPGWQGAAAVLAAPASPVTMALPTFSGLLHIPRKNAWGKHLLSQKFGMTVSFATGLFFHPSPHKEVNKCLLFFLFPYGLFTGFCLCVYECSLALTAVRELFY